MKLFYHFLIFVFASLVLVACANIFTTDSDTKTPDQEPSGLKHGHSNRSDSSAKTHKLNNTYVITSFNYKNLLKTKRWTDKQCNIIDGLKTYIW